MASLKSITKKAYGGGDAYLGGMGALVAGSPHGYSIGKYTSIDEIKNDPKKQSIIAGMLGGGGHVGYMIGAMNKAKQEQQNLQLRAALERQALIQKKAAQQPSRRAADTAQLARQAMFTATPPTSTAQPQRMGATTGVSGVQDALLMLGRPKLGGG